MVRPGDVAKIRIGRMGLVEPLFQHPVEVVEAHLAMQAQDFGPAKWSIAQRLSGRVDSDIEREVSEGSILRTHVLRPTWHFVAARDLRWLMALSGPRVQKSVEARYRQLGLDIKTRSWAEKLISDRLRGGNHLTRRDLGEVLRKSRIEPDGQRLPHLLMHCELEGVITSGPVQGKDQTYSLFDERVPKGAQFDRDRAVVELIRRYLASHGPATLKDMSWWSGLTISDLRAGLEGVGAGVSNGEVGGSKLWGIGETNGTRRRRLTVQMLQTYDEFVVGYTESRYLGDPRAADVRKAFTDRSLPNGTVMLGPRIAGLWRRSLTAKRVEVEVLLYEPLLAAGAVALEKAVKELGRYLGRQSDLSTGVIG
jgi:hypothetical protein